jgi:pimeloyl-ACP methyl ester carboxylesterase
VTAKVTRRLVERPDGAEIHWEERGQGALALVAHHTLWSYPGIYAGLIEDLSRDRRVITYDPRGCGSSTGGGPYDMEVDADDLEAVLESAGGGAVVIAVGDGLNRAARVAARQPALVSNLVAIAPAPAALLPRSELAGSDVIGASESVIDMLFKLLATEPRTALRTLISAVNPDLDESQLRERVDVVADYLSPDAAVARAYAWLEDDVRDLLRPLGARLWILYGGPDPFFEGTLATRVTELFPEAQIEEVADGPVSRPDLTAARVRRLTLS